MVTAYMGGMYNSFSGCSRCWVKLSPRLSPSGASRGQFPPYNFEGAASSGFVAGVRACWHGIGPVQLAPSCVIVNSLSCLFLFWPETKYRPSTPKVSTRARTKCCILLKYDGWKLIRTFIQITKDLFMFHQAILLPISSSFRYTTSFANHVRQGKS